MNRATIGVVGRRTCALLAASSAALHGIMLHHVTNTAAAVLMAAMAVACLYCAHDLWAAGSSRGWLLVAVMNVAMLLVHMPMPTGHQHGAGVATHSSTAMTIATTIAIVEVLAAAAVLSHRTRAAARVMVPALE